jgi:membrane fusion protein (multidrug efflux system)
MAKEKKEKEEIKNTKDKEFVKEAKARLKKRRPEYMKKRVVVPTITAIILVALGIAAAVRATFYQSTDDAFVEGRLVSIAPRVAAPVVKLLVNDNQVVKAGDLLVELDPNDFIQALNQAEAKLAEAKADLNISEKKVDESSAVVNKTFEDITSNQSKLEFAQRDFNRYKELYKDGIVSKQDFEKSKTALDVAIANYNSAEESSRASKHAFESNKAKTESNQALIKRLEAEVEQAKLNLEYTKIYAPQDGMIAARNVEKGNFVTIGQPLMNIVPEEVWVIANFKEIQLTKMKAGQEVKIKIDTYPSKRFLGHVDSIQRSTGAKSSLFPPENAVGSYVKIVQRVPVKIVFDEDISKYNIVPGMSVVPRVKIKSEATSRTKERS